MDVMVGGRADPDAWGVGQRGGNMIHMGPWSRMVSGCSRVWSRGRREDNAGRPRVGCGEQRRPVNKMSH